MTWIDKTLDACDGALVINDSKTPSGRAHVGSLRGVLIHDALARVAAEKGHPVSFLYGCDDMDPVDEVPHGSDIAPEILGKPLCDAPSPTRDGMSMARHYFDEFAETMTSLGAQPQFYRMSDMYRSGQMDNAIAAFLESAHRVRDIYARISEAERADDWLPFQPICETCGRIGTTYAYSYDGSTVGYECRPDLVQWAAGCGHTGRVSPFGGNGKLPWKLEWAAKWSVFGVTAEGAGKDHMAASGSHQVSSALAREILQCAAPVAIPYEFFTLDGAKMSASKGIGMPAAELAGLLPPELIRYVILRTQPKRSINFDLDVATVNKAFVEYERLWRAVDGGKAQEHERQVFAVSQVCADDSVRSAPSFVPPFDSMLSVACQPHTDISEHLAKIGTAELGDTERAWLNTKSAAVEAWMQKFPDTAPGCSVIPEADAAALTLTEAQCSFLAQAEQELQSVDHWSAENIQAALFDALRAADTEAPLAFKALYQIMFGHDEGPRAGEFFEFFGREDTLRRFGLFCRR